MTKLEFFAVSVLLVSTLAIGLTGFVADGLNIYGVSNNANTSELEKIQKIENASTIAETAQTQAENVNAKTSFFTLPNIVSTLKLPFDAIPLWETFIKTGLDILGLDKAHNQWPFRLATGLLAVSVTFAFARRFT